MKIVRRLKPSGGSFLSMSVVMPDFPGAFSLGACVTKSTIFSSIFAPASIFFIYHEIRTPYL